MSPSIRRLATALLKALSVTGKWLRASEVGHKVRVAGKGLQKNVLEPEFLDSLADVTVFRGG